MTDGFDAHHRDPMKGTIRFKHALLRRYLPKFVGMVGKWATDNTVHLYDGYAGAGVFADGSPAGAAHTLRMIGGLESAQRRLVCTYVEKERTHVESLRSIVDADPESYPDVVVRRGDAGACLPEAAARARPYPWFVFLDPYGLSIPFDLLDQHVLRRPNQPGRRTEFLMLYALDGVRRVVGRLTEDVSSDPTVAKARETTLRTADAFFGGTEWRAIVESGAADYADRLLETYASRIRSRGWSTATIPMRDSLGGAVQYYLLFGTRHAEGGWAFTDKVGHAREEWCKELDAAEPQEDLFGEVNVSFDAPTHPTKAQLTSAIADNLSVLLDEHGEVTPLLHVPAMYGTTLGVARAIHVRAALKQLDLDDKATGRHFYRRSYRRL